MNTHDPSDPEKLPELQEQASAAPSARATAEDAGASGDESPAASAKAKTTARPTTANRPPPARRGALLPLWIVVIALAAALFWVWQDGEKKALRWQSEAVQRLGTLEKTQAGQGAREEQYENRLRIAQEKIVSLESRVDELQTGRQVLERMVQQLLPLRDELAMREVEYRIRFAHLQLTMSGNVPSALAALQEADSELEQLNRADLATLKAALSQDIETLQRVPSFDAHALLARLDGALDTIGQLPPRAVPVAMPPAEIRVDPAAPAWRRWWEEIRQTLGAMVRLRIGDVDSGGPHVADTALDRQELRLRLLSLRLMALSRQPQLKSEATGCRMWLEQHFSGDDPGVQRLRGLLDELAASPLATSLPDVTQTLAALRAWRAAQHKTTAAPAH